jgi:hypothetical protein
MENAVKQETGTPKMEPERRKIARGTLNDGWGGCAKVTTEK